MEMILWFCDKKALPQQHLPCVMCVRARKRDLARKHTQTHSREGAAALCAVAFACQAPLRAAGAADWDSLLGSGVAQHPASELIRSMHF